MSKAPVPERQLLGEIRALIEEGRRQVAVTVNVAMSLLYWRIGRRIHQEILQGKRADYGRQVISALAEQLTVEYDGSFSEKDLRRMMQFAEVFPDEEIVVSLIRQLSWTYIRTIISVKDELNAQFYIEMRWIDCARRSTLLAAV